MTRMEYTWYKEDDSHTAPLYAARAVLPYLLTANVRAATTCYRSFTSALTSDSPNLSVQDVSSPSGGDDVRIFPSLPLLNFLGLLLLAVQKGTPDLYRELRRKYLGHINELNGAWDEALELIAEMYLGIQRPRQSNPLMDMMSGLLGGGAFGGAGGGAGGAARPAPRRVQAPPTAEGLD
jgi:golgi to ER traffic protein 4